MQLNIFENFLCVNFGLHLVHPSTPVEATTLYGGRYLRTHPKHVNRQVFQINTVRFCQQMVQRRDILSRKVWDVTLILTTWPQAIHLCMAQLYHSALNQSLSTHEDVRVQQISKWAAQVILKQDSFQFGTYCLLLRSCLQQFCEKCNGLTDLWSN
jgi:hypothetical protein